MTKSRETRLKVGASPDRVLRALTSEAFLIERDRVQGAISVVVEEVSRSDERLVQKVTATQHTRGLTGIDTSKTEEAVTIFSWNLGKRHADWTYRGPHDDRVTVRGTIDVQPDGDGAFIDETFTIEVRVPLMGRKIESVVIDQMTKGFPAYERVVRHHLRGPSRPDEECPSP